MAIDLAEFTITEASARIARGECTASDYVDACLAHIAKCEDGLRAWIHVAADESRMQARLCDSQSAGNVLHGIPFVWGQRHH